MIEAVAVAQNAAARVANNCRGNVARQGQAWQEQQGCLGQGASHETVAIILFQEIIAG